MKKSHIMWYVGVLVAMCFGCPKTPPPVDSIVVSGAASVVVGETVAMSATVSPSDAKQSVTWSVAPATNSSGEATIDAQGKLTGVSAGVVEVTATATDTGKVASKPYRVEIVPSTSDKIFVTSIDVTGPASVVEGETVTISATVSPSDAKQSVTWSVAPAANSSGKATIDAQGKLTGVSAGAVEVIATATDGSNATSQPYKVEVILPAFVLLFDIPAGGVTDFTLPLSDLWGSEPITYDFTVDWGDNTPPTQVTQASDGVHAYTNSEAKTFRVSLTSENLWFGQTYKADGSTIEEAQPWGVGGVDPDKTHYATYLSGIESFGNVRFINENPFSFIQNNITLPQNGSTPYLEGNMGSMFNSAIAFNQYIGDWDMSKVTKMNDMFNNATAFNQDISDWDVSGVIEMANMFQFAKAFNQDIGGWKVGAVKNVMCMFDAAETFDQDLSNWDVSSVEHYNWFDRGTPATWTADEKPSFPE